MVEGAVAVIGDVTVLSSLALLALSFILPLTIFIGRSNIKSVRQKIIADLERVFRIEGQENDPLIPSFEFAAYKYRALPHGPDKAQPMEWRAYFFPVLVFIMVSFCGFLTASGMLLGKERLDHFQPLFSSMTLYGVEAVSRQDLVHYQLQTIGCYPSHSSAPMCGRSIA